MNVNIASCCTERSAHIASCWTGHNHRWDATLAFFYQSHWLIVTTDSATDSIGTVQLFAGARLFNKPAIGWGVWPVSAKVSLKAVISRSPMMTARTMQPLGTAAVAL